MTFTHKRVLPPLIVNGPSEIPWDGQHDVLVVGFGGAGVTAALEALDHGADVALIDRFQGGGATAISGNVVYAGGGTVIQKDAGVEDSPEEMYKYLEAETKGIVTPSTLNKFCMDSAPNLEWLISKGLRFKSSCTLQKTSYPTSKYNLYYSGSETNPKYSALAKPAPRGHVAYGGWRLRATGNPDFYRPLKEAALNQGATCYYHSDVQQIILDSKEKVIGISIKQIPAGTEAATEHEKWSRKANKWHMYAPKLAEKYRKKALEIEETFSTLIYLRAMNGVILATGGFIMNREMLAHYAPLYTKGFSLGTSGCNGSGIALGQSAGGQLDHMDRVTAWRFINPPHAWATGILVNESGERFVDETLYGAAIGDAMCEGNNGTATLIINRSLFWRALTQIMPGKARGFQIIPALLNMFFNTKKSHTVKELAKKIKAPENRLITTLNLYNSAVQEQKKDVFGKPLSDMTDLSKGPYFAMDVSLNSTLFPCPTLTLGGLKVSEETGQVLNSFDKEIDGLYAVGRTAIGIASRSYVSGLSLADCVFSGRRAGKHAATSASLT